MRRVKVGVKWYHVEYCSTLYQWALTEEDKSHPDYKEVLSWLSEMEKIKPHHVVNLGFFS